VFAGLLVLVLGACRGQQSEEPPIHLIRGPMFSQARFDPQAESDLFPDKRTMRPVPAGTVAQGSLKENDQVSAGKNADGSFVKGFPIEVTAETVKRGGERFNIYCTPCHGPLGQGDGMVSKRGYAGVANLHDPRIRALAEGEIFNTVSNGIRLMPGYALQIPESDRWAIIAYLRALQKSQGTQLTELSDLDRAQLK
jgi:mono/diheme cytochrome c family protein